MTQFVGRPGVWRWAGGVLAAAVCVTIVLLQAHDVEDVLKRSGARAIGRVLGGADVTIQGELEAHLLPRPHVVATDVHVHLSGGDADLDIARVEATQSLASLLAGHVSFSQLRLDQPTASLDADKLADGLRATAFGHAMPGRIVVTDAVVAIRSSRPAARGLFTGFNGLLEGLDRNGSATLTGHGAWRGQHIEVTARLEPIFDFALGREAAGSLRLRMPALTASIDGRLRAGIRGGFNGTVALSTPSLANFLASNNLPPTASAMISRVAFTGSGVANADNITFSDAHLTLDDMPFEGSLAWQPNEGHGAWTGTFATDTLDLTRAVARLPQLRDGHEDWSDAPWHLDPTLLGDIDLRVSSNKARIGPVVIEDAAFSALCHDGRIEASLSEAHSTDGLIRGRAVANLAGNAADLRFDLSLSQLDLQPVFAAFGQDQVVGTASGHVAGTARGNSVRSMVHSLAGHGQLSVRQGSLPMLAEANPATGGFGRLWHHGQNSSSFDLATADLDIQGDRIDVLHGRMTGADLQDTFTGGVSLLNRSFLLVAVGDDMPVGTTPLNVAGTWDPVLRVARAPAPVVAPGQGLRR